MRERTAGSQRTDVTALLRAWSDGESSAADELMPIVLDELRRLARNMMRGERPGHTLQTTAVVNEAYMRLIDLNRVRWEDRAHFFAMSARLMRRVLVDHARSRNSIKRGGTLRRVSLEDSHLASEGDGHDLVQLDAALEALAAVDPRKSRVVELRFFGGLSVDETAHALKISPETVARDWRMAKAWLARELGAGERP